MQPLGIALKKALPERIDLEEGFELAWDVTGGDADGMRETQVHIETDDGIVIADDTAWGYSNYWRFDAHGEDVSGSRYVIITLTPRDSSSTGDPFTEQIQLAQQETGGTLVLPRGLTTIEEEAFLYVAASEFDIPDGVSFIGQNAFPNNATLIVGSDSYAKTWAEENGYAYTVR